MDSYFAAFWSWKGLKDGFVSYKHASFRFRTIICGLLWCLYSDGTHSLQSIHFWDTDAETHFSKSVLMKKQTCLILDGLSVSAFLANYMFASTIPISRPLLHKLIMHAFLTKIAHNMGIETVFLHIWWYYKTVKVTISATFIKKTTLKCDLIWLNIYFRCLGRLEKLCGCEWSNTVIDFVDCFPTA